jgi:hypothetical protein
MATGTTLDPEDEEMLLRPAPVPPSISRRGDAPPACTRAAVHLPSRRAICRGEARASERKDRRNDETVEVEYRTGERKEGLDGACRRA